MLSGTNAIIVGLTRNSASTIVTDVQRLSEAVGPAHWFIVESDSSDDTAECLDGIKKTTPNFRFSSLGNLRSAMPSRTERLAYCRNHYLQEIATNPIYTGLKYVIVADFDNVNRMISSEAIQSCFERNDWGVCAANQRGPYYDIWALRHETWSPGDCLAEYRGLMQNGMSERKALSRAVYSKMIRVEETAPWVSVMSAFGGLAIYRAPIPSNARYSGRTTDGEEVCEHVPFHMALNSRIFINPRLINAEYTQHSMPLRFFPSIAWHAKLFLKSLIRAIGGQRALAVLKRSP